MSTTNYPSGRKHPLIEAKEYLERTLVAHERFDEAITQITGALVFPTDVKLLCVIGPTGVGKSRLYDSVQKRVLSLIAQDLIDDRERVPYVAFEVPSVQIGNFSWRSFYQEYLDQLRLPLTPAADLLKDIPRISEDHGPDYVLMKTLEHRRPLVTLLDEANHFAAVASGKLLRHQMDKIKSMANRSQVLHICFGTYELANMINLSGQLARRIKVIHFGRYRAENSNDIKAFDSMVCRFQNKLPVAHHFDLTSRLSYLHERTIGCAGILKTWLMEALSRAFSNKRTEIAMADLEATACPINKLNKMLAEAIQGEAAFREAEQDRELFRHTLGHTPEIFAPALGDDASKSSHQPVGERAPRRDPTGGAFNGQTAKLAS